MGITAQLSKKTNIRVKTDILKNNVAKKKGINDRHRSRHFSSLIPKDSYSKIRGNIFRSKRDLIRDKYPSNKDARGIEGRHATLLRSSLRQ